MAIAVLFPVYYQDSAELFEKALQSVVKQDDCPEDIRIYLGVDGPLGTELEKVIQNNHADIYKLVRNPVHIGPAGILNKLIAELGNERLIFRMDADDISLPGRFRRQVEFMDANPDIHILGTSIEEYDTVNGECVLRTYPTDPEKIPKSICFASPVAHPSVCFRPDVLHVRGGYPDIRGQDLSLWFEALCQGFRISNLEEPFVRMNVSPSFYARRRSTVRMWPEFKIFMTGIWKLHGVTWRYIFPLARLMFRLTPSSFARFIYKSGLRNYHAKFDRNRSEFQ